MHIVCLLIAPAKTLFQGSAFNVPIAEFTLRHSVAWVQVLEPRGEFLMALGGAAVCCDSRSESICPSPGANPRLCRWQNASTLKQGFLYGLRFVRYIGLQLFHQFFAAYIPSYLSQRFRTLIRQSKELYSTVLLSNFCAHWPTGAFWHGFVSLIVVSWQQFCHIGRLHRVFSSVDVDIFFMTLVQLCSDVWRSHPSVMQAVYSAEIVLCIGKTGYCI